MDGNKTRVWLAILTLASGAAGPGCERPLVVPASDYHVTLAETHLRRPDWSGSTAALLENLGLDDLAWRCPAEAFCLLEKADGSDTADSRRLLALAELAALTARRSPRYSWEAIRWSRDAAVYAVFCLTELEGNQPGASTECAARDVHNRALACCLEAGQPHARLCRGSPDWAARLREAGIVAIATPEWSALGFDSLEPAAGHAILRSGAGGCREGWGTPLIARHTLDETEQRVWKPYGPRDAVFAVTAVIQPRGTSATWRTEPVELVLYNPVREETVILGGRSLPLAADLMSPLTHRLTQSPMQYYEFAGLIDAGIYSSRAGVYALDPYQAGKIPVVLVHGLWSSPAVWMSMLAALRSDPVLRRSYQFWVALYPSGYPLPLAALSLRRSLREARRTFDPEHLDLALDQMVILGKSTGGQVSRMLVQPSGESLWNAVFTRPITEINAPPELLAELRAMFFFEPEPYVRRVIFVTTAHQGGKLAGNPMVRLGATLIRRNNPLHEAWAHLEAANGRAVFQPHFQARAPSSIDGMEAGNPLLAATGAQTIAPRIVYHSIIANIRRSSAPQRMHDGLVSYQSAHLDGAASEHIVAAHHVCEDNPMVIEEVQRILHANLSEN